MFGIFTPIAFNTNFNSFFGSYSPYYARYSPFAVFNRDSFYGGIGMGYSYFNNYGYNNYYSNVFAMNYAPRSYYGGYSGRVNYSVPIISSSSAVTNPVRTDSAFQANNSVKLGKTSTLGQEFVNVARKYLDCGEYNNSHLKFCNNPTCGIEDPFNEEWCTDFVTYVVKEAYKNKGQTPPAGFGGHDVKTVKDWAINNGYFIRTNDKSQKGDFIAKNIKVGDIMVINENKYSHIGIVTKIDSNGIIHTIEGNRDDRVKEYKYSPNYPNLSGFIRLTF